MTQLRRATPFGLLVLLGLGSALGAGLGLVQAPNPNPSAPSGTTSQPALPPRRANSTPTTGSIPVSVGAPSCTSQSLQVSSSAVNTEVPARRTQGVVTLLNTSSAPCELATIPLFEVIGNNGMVLANSVPGKELNDLIRPGEAQAATISWLNWCGADLRPVSFAVILPSAGGTLSIPLGNGGTQLPTCNDRSQPSRLFVHGRGGSAPPFGR